MRLLLDEGTYPAIATHDEATLAETRAYAAERAIARDRFEFQMLYGIRRDLQTSLVAAGYRMRIYVLSAENGFPISCGDWASGRPMWDSSSAPSSESVVQPEGQRSRVKGHRTKVTLDFVPPLDADSEEPVLRCARQVAAAAHSAGGRALIVGGWVRDRLMRRRSKDLDIEIFGIEQDRVMGLLTPIGRVEPVGQSFPSTRSSLPAAVISTSRSRAAESKRGRGHKGFEVRGDPFMSHRRCGAPARLHDQRDRLGPAERRFRGSLRGTGRPRAARASRRRSIDLRRRQPARAGGHCSFPPASSSRWTRTRPRCAERSRSTTSQPERVWGEVEKLLLQAAAAFHWPRAGARPWRHRTRCCRSCTPSSAASRNPSGIRKATSGRTR